MTQTRTTNSTTATARPNSHYTIVGASIDAYMRRFRWLQARHPGGGKFKDLRQQKDDQQLQPMQKPFLGASSGSWGCGVARRFR